MGSELILKSSKKTGSDCVNKTFKKKIKGGKDAAFVTMIKRQEKYFKQTYPNCLRYTG